MDGQKQKHIISVPFSLSLFHAPLITRMTRLHKKDAERYWQSFLLGSGTSADVHVSTNVPVCLRSQRVNRRSPRTIVRFGWEVKSNRLSSRVRRTQRSMMIQLKDIRHSPVWTVSFWFWTSNVLSLDWVEWILWCGFPAFPLCSPPQLPARPCPLFSCYLICPVSVSLVCLVFQSWLLLFVLIFVRN